MELDEFFKYMGVAVTGIGSISGSIWAFRKWWVRDEHFPRVAFDLKVNFIDEVDSQHIVEVIAILENKGVVPLRICNFTCDIRGIKEGEKLQMGGEAIRNQLNFNVPLRSGWFIPTGWKYSFVYPSVKTDYNFVTTVASDTRYALVKCTFEYYRHLKIFGNNRSHHATVVLKIPNNSSKRDSVTGSPS